MLTVQDDGTGASVADFWGLRLGSSNLHTEARGGGKRLLRGLDRGHCWLFLCLGVPFYGCPHNYSTTLWGLHSGP